MLQRLQPPKICKTPVVSATGEDTILSPGDRVRVDERFPVGHYRVPLYVRGKSGVVDSILQPAEINNEEEGFGRNAGMKRHYYRIVFALTDLWPIYVGSLKDALAIEIFETWLERD